MTGLDELQKATIHILVRLGFLLPNRPFIEEWIQQTIKRNHDVFDRLAIL